MTLHAYILTAQAGSHEDAVVKPLRVFLDQTNAQQTLERLEEAVRPFFEQVTANHIYNDRVEATRQAYEWCATVLPDVKWMELFQADAGGEWITFELMTAVLDIGNMHCPRCGGFALSRHHLQTCCGGTGDVF